MSSHEPEEFIPSEVMYFVNYTKRLSAIDQNLSPFEITKIYLNEGFIRVDERTLRDCREEFEKYWQARIRKTLLQKQRRAMSAKTRKPRVKKPRTIIKQKTLWEILTNNIVNINPDPKPDPDSDSDEEE